MIKNHELETMSICLNDMIEILEKSKLNESLKASVVGKMLVMYFIHKVGRDDFLADMASLYDFESIMRPDEGELH